MISSSNWFERFHKRTLSSEAVLQFHDARRSGRSSLVDAERDAGDADKDVAPCTRKVVTIRRYQRRVIT
ncbi:hypothetical protein [Diadegma fenestrale ichnovirus]|nr:hypothetical protein [Diadegma fenestrale ichnovirus]